MYNSLPRLIVFSALSLAVTAVSSFSIDFLQKTASSNTKNDQEMSSESHYQKWLKEDVLYIITDEEKTVFQDLTTDEERESFIEQFWLRRDPNPRTAYNEYKEEHYRRIAYANDYYAGGIPGWKTDRGRIYITYGKPDEITKHPGGPYNREHWEGGGVTYAYPFELWRYRYIEGLGQDVEIEFVDPTLTGEFRIAMSAEEKDAFVNVPGQGLTMYEELGLADPNDREFLKPAGAEQFNFLREKDLPFQRMEQYFDLQLPPQIKFTDLRGIVDTHIIYNELPCQLRMDFVRLSSDSTIVPITIEVSNSDLQYKKELDFNRAVVNVYGLVTSITGRILAEFEHSISSEFIDSRFDQGKKSRSVYQKVVVLPPGQRVKVDLVLKDVNSGDTGVVSQGLLVPQYSGEDLQASSVILAREITPLQPSSDRLEQFVLGDLKVQPHVTSEYQSGEILIPYLQVYNVGIDQTSLEPSLQLKYTVKNSNGEVVSEYMDTQGDTVGFFSSERVVVIANLQLKSFKPGDYDLEIKVLDQISDKSLIARTAFSIN